MLVHITAASATVLQLHLSIAATKRNQTFFREAISECQLSQTHGVTANRRPGRINVSFVPTKISPENLRETYKCTFEDSIKFGVTDTEYDGVDCVKMFEDTVQWLEALIIHALREVLPEISGSRAGNYEDDSLLISRKLSSSENFLTACSRKTMTVQMLVT
jgi:hypothetical protein